MARSSRKGRSRSSLTRPRCAAWCLLGPAAAAAVVVLGCTTVPRVKYYNLGGEAGDAVSTAGPGRHAVRVERFIVAEPYASRRIVYRPEDAQVAFWEFHQWAAPPDRIITARIAELIAKAGLFKKVDAFPYSMERVDFVLRGAVLAFEEIDRDDGWYGHVKILFELTDARSGDVVWSRKVEIERRAGGKNAGAVVGALSEALDEAVGIAVDGMAQAVR